MKNLHTLNATRNIHREFKKKKKFFEFFLSVLIIVHEEDLLLYMRKEEITQKTFSVQNHFKTRVKFEEKKKKRKISK